MRIHGDIMSAQIYRLDNLNLKSTINFHLTINFSNVTKAAMFTFVMLDLTATQICCKSYLLSKLN